MRWHCCWTNPEGLQAQTHVACEGLAVNVVVGGVAVAGVDAVFECAVACNRTAVERQSQMDHEGLEHSSWCAGRGLVDQHSIVSPKAESAATEKLNMRSGSTERVSGCAADREKCC